MINIDEKIKNALKSKNEIELKVFRNLKAKILEFKTAKNAKPYNETSELNIINKYAKSLEDAIRQFSEANREDLIKEYTSELEVVKKLLPKPINESDIHHFIKNDSEYFSQFYDEFILENGEKTSSYKIPKKEMGNAIKHLKSKFPTVDGKLISEIIKMYING